MNIFDMITSEVVKNQAIASLPYQSGHDDAVSLQRVHQRFASLGADRLSAHHPHQGFSMTPLSLSPKSFDQQEILFCGGVPGLHLDGLLNEKLCSIQVTAEK